MKFIRHKEGIVAAKYVDEIVVQKISKHREGVWSAGFAISLLTKEFMRIVEVYPTIEEAEKELENFYNRLEPNAAG